MAWLETGSQKCLNSVKFTHLKKDIYIYIHSWRPISGNTQALLKSSALQTETERVIRLWILGNSPDHVLFLWKAGRLLAATTLLLEPVLENSNISRHLHPCSAKRWNYFFAHGLWFFNNMCVRDLFYFEKSPVYCGDRKSYWKWMLAL